MSVSCYEVGKNLIHVSARAASELSPLPKILYLLNTGFRLLVVLSLRSVRILVVKGRNYMNLAYYQIIYV